MYACMRVFMYARAYVSENTYIIVYKYFDEYMSCLCIHESRGN
jgi:hypothetical protein